jgi:hypothetical protein
MTVAAFPPSIDSPCNRICAIDPVSGFCIGCGRTIAEISEWIGMRDGERARIMAELPQRLADRSKPESEEQA